MKPRLRKRIRTVAVCAATLVVVGVLFVSFGNEITRAFESEEASVSLGTTGDGRLVNGKRLPTSGANFRAYGRLPIAFGRNSLHGRVREVVLDAYGRVLKLHPDTEFVYAECSWPSGVACGRMRRTGTVSRSILWFR